MPFNNNQWEVFAKNDKTKFLGIHKAPFTSLEELKKELENFIIEESMINEKIKQFILRVEKDYFLQQNYKGYLTENTDLSDDEINAFFEHFRALNGNPISQTELATRLGINPTDITRSITYKEFIRHTAYYSFKNNKKYKESPNRFNSDLNNLIEKEWNSLIIFPPQEVKDGKNREASDNGDLPAIWENLSREFDATLAELTLAVNREHLNDLQDKLKVEEIVKKNYNLIITWNVITYGSSLAECKLYFFIHKEKVIRIIEKPLEARLFFREYCKKIYNAIFTKIIQDRVEINNKLIDAKQKNYRGRKESK